MISKRFTTLLLFIALLLSVVGGLGFFAPSVEAVTEWRYTEGDSIEVIDSKITSIDTRVEELNKQVTETMSLTGYGDTSGLVKNYYNEIVNLLTDKKELMIEQNELRPIDNFDQRLADVQQQIRDANNRIQRIKNPNLYAEDVKKAIERKAAEGCGWSNPASCIPPIIEKVITYTDSLIVGPVLGKALYLVGSGFDLVVETTVTNFSAITSSPAVTTIWATMRDIANLFFIFIALYIAIGMILNLKNFNANQMLVNLIVVALLVNFSAYFARTIIDITNAFAVQIYKPLSVNTPYKIPETNKTVYGVSGVLMKHLNLQEQFKNSNGNPGQAGVALVGKIIVFIVAGFAFFAGAALLITRAITLIFLVTFAPLAFLAYATPKLEGRFWGWWDKLLSQAFFAPIYFLFLYISIQVITTGPLSDLVGTGVTNMAMRFVLIIGLMLGSLIAAQQIGIKSAGAAMKGLNKFRGFATGAVVGGAGALALRAKTRATLAVGSAAEKIQKDQGKVSRFLRQMPLATTIAAKAGAAARKQVGTAQSAVEAKGYSEEALKNIASKRLTSTAKKTAITNILAGKSNLKPDRGFGEQQIQQAIKIQQGIGASTKPIQSLSWQYANTPTDQALAIRGAAATATSKAVPQMNSAVIEQLKLDDWFMPAPGMIGHDPLKHTPNKQVREAMYKVFNKNHIDNLMKRPDQATDRFMENLKHDFMQTSYHTTSPAGIAGTAPTMSDLEEWLRAPVAGIPGIPMSQGADNKLLETWAHSPAGQNILRSYGFA